MASTSTGDGGPGERYKGLHLHLLQQEALQAGSTAERRLCAHQLQEGPRQDISQRAPAVRDAGGDAGVRLVGVQPLEAGPVPRQDRGEGRRTCPRAHDARREGQGIPEAAPLQPRLQV